MTDNNGYPKGWVLSTVGEIYKVLSGGTPSTKVKEYWGGDIPWITSANIHGLKDIRPERTVTQSGIENSATNLVPRGSIIVVTRVSLGKVALADTDICFSQDSQGLLPTDKVLPGYALYYLSWAAREFQSKSRGTTISGITKKQLLTLEFPLPPLPEQECIVAKIEELFTLLEAGVAELQAAKAQLQRYRQAVLKSAVEGELTREWRVAHQSELEPAKKLLARILSERRTKWEAEELAKLRAKGKEPKNDKWQAKYKEPPPPDTEDLPELPDGWVWASVEQIGVVNLGRQRSPKHHTGPYMRPYLRAANITWDGFDLSDVMEMNFPPSDFETYRLEVNDVLVNEASGSRSEVGKPAVWKGQIEDCCFQNTIIRVRSLGPIPTFLYVHFLSDAKTGRFGHIAKGVGIHHLGATRLSAMPMRLPPIKEQQRIVEMVERRLSVADEIEKELDQALARSEQLRQSILKRAFEGKLV